MKRILSGKGRRGSALIIVLGILSVLILLAVAFATFERTERGGTTNLKNAFVARNSLATAVGRVMEAVDNSFDSPAGDDPVAPWPHPWLASSGDPMLDYLQSETRPSGSGNNANVLTAEIAQYLSPAQIALVKAAKCNWAPIHGSIAASAAGGSDRVYGGTYGDVGRPRADDLIGRYAFVVLETTGLADLNMTGTGGDEDAIQNRKTGVGRGTSGFLIPYANALDSDKRDVKPFLSMPENLPAGRAFSSLADAIQRCAAGTFATNKAEIADIVNSSARKHYPADLFAGFAPSLSDLDPEGLPKVRLPSWAEFNTWKSGRDQIDPFAVQTMEAMTKIFAWSREESERGTSTQTGRDELTIFEGAPAQYKLPRAVLATVALLDGMDCDGKPGACEDPSWDYLGHLGNPPEVGVSDYSGGLHTVSERGLSSVPAPRNLNFPCTESSALLDTVVAYVSDISYDDTEEERVYTIEVTVRARAHCQNKTAESSIHTSRMTVEWEIGSSDPGWMDDLTLHVTDPVAEDVIDWSEADGFGSDSDDEKTIDDASGRGKTQGGFDRCIEVEDAAHFEVHCKAKPVLDSHGDVVGYDGYYPLTAAQYRAEEGEDAPDDVFLPILVKVTIEDKKNATRTDGVNKTHAWQMMQEVPAPALGDDYRIPLHAGIYHSGHSSFGGPRYDPDDPHGADVDECFSFGWAFCLAPAFAFDTTSLKNPGGTDYGFWIGDEAGFSSGGGGGRPGGDSLCPDLGSLLWEDGNDTIKDWSSSGDRLNGEIFNEFQKTWLLNAEAVDYDPDPISGWLDTTARHVPDFRHASSHNGTEFGRGAGNHNGELYSWIPAMGYSRPADLGMVMCGPLETLSTFKTWRKGGDGVDFHRVLDYFETWDSKARYPGPADGTDWAALSGSRANPQLLFSGIHNGLVNLNAPFLVKCTKPTGAVSVNNPPVRGDRSDRLNPYPIATVFNGAPLFYYVNADEDKAKKWHLPEQIVTLLEEDAVDLVGDLCKSLESLSMNDARNVAVAHRFTDDANGVVRRRVVRDLSFLGRGNGNANDILSSWIQAGGWRQIQGDDYNAKPENDYEREGLLRGVADGFTTRGQTFLAIIRADAYSPKFGENSSAEDGTTLATTHALVELFRDPVPARTPEGTMPSDGSRPVSFHNWYIRSFRVF